MKTTMTSKLQIGVCLLGWASLRPAIPRSPPSRQSQAGLCRPNSKRANPCSMQTVRPAMESKRREPTMDRHWCIRSTNRTITGMKPSNGRPPIGVKAHHWEFGNMPKIDAVTPADVDQIVKYVRWQQRQAGIQ